MRRQNLGDLNGYLFEQLERLNDPDLTEKEVQTEIERSRAVASVANQIINNGVLALRVKRTFDESINPKMPAMLDADTAEKVD